MRTRLAFLILFLCFQQFLQAQSDKRLIERLDSTLTATRHKDFNTVLDFTYPKIFDIVERDQMMSVLRSTFENDQFIIGLDSLRILNVGPVIKVGTGEYVKIRHTMLMIFQYKDTSNQENIEVEKLTANTMAMQYGDENVSYDEKTRSIRVFTKPEMVAIRDEKSSEWTFLNYKKDDMFVDYLLSKEVRDKLKEN